MELNHIYNGDSLDILKTLPSNSIDCGVTSPPYYGLRDYGVDGQIGLEKTPEQFIEKLVCVFHEFRRVLKPEGTLWVNIGDSYAGNSKPGGGDPTIGNRNLGGSEYRQKHVPDGIKSKDLIGIPWMLAFALRSDGWYLRQDIIWSKPNSMPESVTDRCTKSHEYIFLLSKSQRYYFDSEAIKEPCVQDEMANGFRGGAYCNNETFDNSTGGQRKNKGNQRYGGNKYTADPDIFYRTKSGNAYEPRDKRNKRSVWNIATKPYREAHFATFPEELITPCILAGCPQGGIVLDMFFGSGTTGLVALKNFRNYIGIELNSRYVNMANRRLEDVKAQNSIFDYGIER
jgi:DNA modification methylase